MRYFYKITQLSLLAIACLLLIACQQENTTKKVTPTTTSSDKEQTEYPRTPDIFPDIETPDGSYIDANGITYTIGESQTYFTTTNFANTTITYQDGTYTYSDGTIVVYLATTDLYTLTLPSGESQSDKGTNALNQLLNQHNIETIEVYDQKTIEKLQLINTQLNTSTQ